MPTTPRLIEPLTSRSSVNEAWKKHRHHIVNALSRSEGAFSEEHVLTGVLKGEMDMWPSENSVLITQVTDYPNYKCVSFLIAGGILEELIEMQKQIIEIAKKAGCTKAVIIDARKGWAKVLDYRLASVNLVKDI